MMSREQNAVRQNCAAAPVTFAFTLDSLVDMTEREQNVVRQSHAAASDTFAFTLDSLGRSTQPEQLNNRKRGGPPVESYYDDLGRPKKMMTKLFAKNTFHAGMSPSAPYGGTSGEPMSLGSPRSPKPISAQFLSGFLLGDSLTSPITGESYYHPVRPARHEQELGGCTDGGTYGHLRSRRRPMAKLFAKNTFHAGMSPSAPYGESSQHEPPAHIEKSVAPPEASRYEGVENPRKRRVMDSRKTSESSESAVFTPPDPTIHDSKTKMRRLVSEYRGPNFINQIRLSTYLLYWFPMFRTVLDLPSRTREKTFSSYL